MENTFSRWLKKYEMSHREFADYPNCPVSRPMIWRYAMGRIVPSPVVAFKIEEITHGEVPYNIWYEEEHAKYKASQSKP